VRLAGWIPLITQYQEAIPSREELWKLEACSLGGQRTLRGVESYLSQPHQSTCARQGTKKREITTQWKRFLRKRGGGRPGAILGAENITRPNYLAGLRREAKTELGRKVMKANQRLHTLKQAAYKGPVRKML